MVLPIYLYGHPVLRKPTAEVTPDYPNLQQLIENMKETMYNSDGIGIAAPQVGVPIKLIYIDVDILKDDMPELKDRRLVLINPEVIVDETIPAVTREEGCLSVPGIHESVSRHEKILLRYTDENWQQHEEAISGYLARVVQHENDHLHATLFVDRIAPIRKQLIKSRLHSIEKGKIRCDYRVRTAHDAPKR